jgi:hypothetical protein
MVWTDQHYVSELKDMNTFIATMFKLALGITQPPLFVFGTHFSKSTTLKYDAYNSLPVLKYRICAALSALLNMSSRNGKKA